MDTHIADSIDVVLDLLKNNSKITALKFVTYKDKPGWPALDKIEKLQEGIFRHSHNADGSILVIPRNGLSRDSLSGLCSKLGPQERLGLISGVQSEGNAPMFIPMMDFICEKNEKNLQLIASQIKHLHRIKDFDLGGGVIIETNKSYHYQAKLALPTDKWTKFIGHVLLMHPPHEHREVAARESAWSVIDVRYVGHSLIDGAEESTLRISQNADGAFPRVVRQIEARN